MRGCSVQQQGESLRLRLELGAQMAYRSFNLSNPERLVIDLSGVSLQSPRMDPVPAGAAVTRIRSELHLDGLRVVLDLQQPCSTNLRWEGGALVLELAAMPGSVALSASGGAAAAAPRGQAEPSEPTRSRLQPYVVTIDAATAARIRARSVPMRVTKNMWPWQ